MTGTAAQSRRMLAEMARERTGANRGRRLLRWTLWLTAVAALAVLLFGWFQGWFTTHPKVAAARQEIGRQISALEQAGAGQASLAVFDKKMDKLQKQVRSLPRDLRRQLNSDLEQLSAARDRAEVNSYFSLPPTQRQAAIDRRLQEEEKARQARAAARATKDKRKAQTEGRSAGSGDAQRPEARSGGPGGGGQGPAGSGSPRQAQAGNGAKPGSGGKDGARSDRSVTQGPKTEETTALRRKQRIDNTDPQQRALRAEYRRLIDQRRAQLGLATGKR